MSSPAERYAAARKRQAHASSELARFEAGFDFPFDDFQREGCAALERGEGVLVAAPTGAGKTIVGEFAVHLGLAQGLKTFYTTPIKALSNQKYSDFAARYGASNVGLLTGDTTLNPQAPVLVMTTEVLRNMLYAGSSHLAGLGYVVMDEVHYLADRFRGPVWEEVIIHLPASVQVVSLSATVSNAEEFGDWLGHVRGKTAVVVSEHRPVPLTQHMLVGRKLYDLYSVPVAVEDARSESRHLAAPPLNPELIKALHAARRASQGGPARPEGDDGAAHHPGRGRGKGHGHGGARGGYRGRRARPGWKAPHQRRGGSLEAPPRVRVVKTLAEASLLPAIVFIFSRARCDEAVSQLLRGDVVLTSQEEADRIREVIDTRTAALASKDLAVLGFDQWAAALERGYAAHHAGLLPVFKEIIEELFAAGLIKVVYATETLALGINMPARTVVLESLKKWDGSGHTPLTPGQYTQLTGRAGRRGIDTEGHAVVIASDDAEPSFVSSLASRRTYPLHSAFRPTYNMAINLLLRSTRRQARDILESSFAQFQADRGVVELAAQARRLRRDVEGLREQMHCHLGDFSEYALLRQRISDAEDALARARKGERRQAASARMTSLRYGEVVIYHQGRRRKHGIVLDIGIDRTGTTYLTLLNEHGDLARLTPDTHPDGVTRVGSLSIPSTFNFRKPAHRAELHRTLTRALERGELDESQAGAEAAAGTGAAASAKNRGSSPSREIEELRHQMRAHPCHACPDRESHARIGRQWAKAVARSEALEARITTRTGTLARQFDAVCQVLLRLGYLQPTTPGKEDGELTVTPAGLMLARVYTERDLLVAECIRQGTWRRLRSHELAGAVAACVYETRPGQGRFSIPVAPGSNLGQALHVQRRISQEIYSAEVLAGMEPSGGSEAMMSGAIQSWASGDELAEVLGEIDISPGDFVRLTKQLLDVLGQVSTLDPAILEVGSKKRALRGIGPLAHVAAQACLDLERGIVAWSTL